MSGFSKAHAETLENERPVGVIEKFFHNGDITNNPFRDKGFNFNIGDYTPEQIQFFFDLIKGRTTDYVLKKDVLIDVVDLAIRCLSYVYSFITKTIIATPSVVFNSTWFADSYLKFATISVVVFTLMALWNAGRKTFNLSATSLSDVIKRYFLAITGIGFATFFFQQFFKVVKLISELIVSIGYSEIFSKDFTSFSSLTTGDTVALVLFIGVIIGLTVKILLENFRRWFGLASIGLMSSFSLSAWVFDATKNIFSDVKEKFIKLSITQIYHASIISMIGIFLVGTSGVEDFTGLLIKLGMITGGFTFLSRPPKFLDRLIDKNTETVLTMVDQVKDILSYKLNPAFVHGADILKKSLGLHDKLTQPSKLEKRLKLGKRFVK